MKLRLHLLTTVKDNDFPFTEDYDKPFADIEEAKKWAQDLVGRFNESRRPYESARTLVRVEYLGESEPAPLDTGAHEEEREPEEVIEEAATLLLEYGGFDGAHHKQWVIDQTLRILLGKRYAEVVRAFEYPDGETQEYEWETGIAP